MIHVDGKDALLMGLKRELRHARIENAALRGKLSLPAEGPVAGLLAGLSAEAGAEALRLAHAELLLEVDEELVRRMAKWSTVPVSGLLLRAIVVGAMPS